MKTKKLTRNGHIAPATRKPWRGRAYRHAWWQCWLAISENYEERTERHHRAEALRNRRRRPHHKHLRLEWQWDMEVQRRRQARAKKIPRDENGRFLTRLKPKARERS